jgi:hypothetical protein
MVQGKQEGLVVAVVLVVHVIHHRQQELELVVV